MGTFQNLDGNGGSAGTFRRLNDAPTGRGTRQDPFDLSAGQSRASIPRGAFYTDPQGNLRRNDNADAGNPIITSASRRKADSGARRDMRSRDEARAQREGIPLSRAVREQDRASALIQGYSGLADEIMGLRSAAKTGVLNLLGQDQGYTAREAYDARRQAEQDRYRGYLRDYPVEGTAGVVGGALANPLNIVAGQYVAGANGSGAVLRAAQSGGALGAAYGAAQSDPGQRVRGAVEGGALGAAAGGALQLAGNVAGTVSRRPRPPSAARELSRQGVDLTPGQMLGGVGQRVEDAFTSVPIAGDAIRNAQRRTIGTFNRAALDRVLEPIGGSGQAIGRQGARDTSAQVSAAYQNALDGVTVTPDTQFADDVAQVLQTSRTPPAVRGDLNAFVDDVLERLQGPVDGPTWKAIDSDLAAAIRSADTGSSSNPSLRFLRDSLRELRTAVGGAMERSNGPAFEAVRQADEASAMLTRVREASQYQGTAAREGLFTAGDLNRAVRGMDTSAGNRAYAQGNALLQDLAEPAVQVLPSTVPDSGTAIRSAFTGSPQGLVVGAVTGIPTGILYSRPVQSILNQIYRATDGVQAAEGVRQLAELAARQPVLAPLVRELQAQLDGPGASGSRSRETSPALQMQ